MSHDPSTDAMISIMFLQMPDDVAALENAAGNDTDRAIAYLAQWDYGAENDEAASVLGTQELSAIKALGHEPHQRGGIEYWYHHDPFLGTYSLYRRPLNTGALR